MAINKVIFGNDTLIDITDTTATAGKIVSGYTAYGANGVKMTGSFDPSIYVQKTGSTMTGSLNFNGTSAIISTHINNIDTSDPYVYDYTEEAYSLYDAGTVKIGTIGGKLNADGKYGISLGTHKSIGGTLYGNKLNLLMDSSGNSAVEISQPAAWKNALGLGNVKMIPVTVSANNGTAVFVFSGTCAFSIFSSGADATIRQHTHGYCTSTGTVSETKNPSGATGVTFTNASYKLTVKNTSQYTMYMILIAYGNPDNVSLQ